MKRRLIARFFHLLILRKKQRAQQVVPPERLEIRHLSDAGVMPVSRYHGQRPFPPNIMKVCMCFQQALLPVIHKMSTLNKMHDLNLQYTPLTPDDKHRHHNLPFEVSISLTFKSGFPILTSNESKFLSKLRRDQSCPESNSTLRHRILP